MSYLFFKKDVKKRCYWCCEDDKRQLSDDHLPPKSIFPKEEREGLQLITATICNRCKRHHQRAGEDDEMFMRYMRFWASLRGSTEDMSTAIEACIRRDRWASNHGIVLAEFLKVTSSDGRTKDYPVLMEHRQAILGVLDSIARGFYYRSKGKTIPEHVRPEFEFSPRGSFQPPLNLLTVVPRIVVKRDVFEFSVNRYSDGTLNYLSWEFQFYNLTPMPIYYCY